MVCLTRTTLAAAALLSSVAFVQVDARRACTHYRSMGACLHGHRTCAWDDEEGCLSVAQEAKRLHEDDVHVPEISPSGTRESVGENKYVNCRSKNNEKCIKTTGCVWNFRSNSCMKDRRRLRGRRPPCKAHVKSRLCNEDKGCIWSEMADKCMFYNPDGFCEAIGTINECALESEFCNWDEKNEECVTIKSLLDPRDEYIDDLINLPDLGPSLGSAECDKLSSEDCNNSWDCFWDTSQGACTVIEPDEEEIVSLQRFGQSAEEEVDEEEDDEEEDDEDEGDEEEGDEEEEDDEVSDDEEDDEVSDDEEDDEVSDDEEDDDEESDDDEDDDDGEDDEVSDDDNEGDDAINDDVNEPEVACSMLKPRECKEREDCTFKGKSRRCMDFDDYVEEDDSVACADLKGFACRRRDDCSFDRRTKACASVDEIPEDGEELDSCENLGVRDCRRREDCTFMKKSRKCIGARSFS